MNSKKRTATQRHDEKDPAAIPDKTTPLSAARITEFLQQVAPFPHVEQLFGCLPDINYFAKDQAGRFVQMDDGFVAMLGCKSRTEILGRTDHDIFPKDMADKYVADDRTVMKTGQPLLQLVEPLPDAQLTINWWETNKFPLRNRQGHIIGLAGITSKLSPSTIPSHYGSGLFAVLRAISERYSTQLNMATLAREAGLSVRSLERHFVSTFKTTPLRYVNRVRLHAARHCLIHTNKTLAEIAEECGFYDQSHMTTVFSQQLKISPKRYRTANRATYR